MNENRRPGSDSPRDELEQREEIWDGIRELKREVSDLRQANESREPKAPASVVERASGHERRWEGVVRFGRPRRRLRVVVGMAVVAIVLAVGLSTVFGSADSFSLPSHAALAGMGVRERIVAIARSQLGYGTNPSDSYCNKFSAYWHAGTAGCPNGETSEQWCADFAAWTWRKAGVPFVYGFGPGQVNASAASFYEWGVANRVWHPATDGYLAAPGDLAVYGLALGAHPSATHVAIVTGDTPGQGGPDVVNGDGDRTAFSVVESGTDQLHADVSRVGSSVLAGYVSVPQG
jgi:hypothetical protein